MGRMKEQSRRESQGQNFKFVDIKGEMLNRIKALLAELLPEGHRAGGYYISQNPTRDDANAGSFWIRLSSGAWRDEATGDKGDLIGLVKYVLRHNDLSETRAWCLSWLGWASGIDRDTLEKSRAVASVHAKKVRKEEREAAEVNARKAFGWWLKGEKKLAGTPVDLYLASRGIDLGRLAALPGAIRYLPNATHLSIRGDESLWPCMIVAMCNGQGSVVAVHRTWLTPDGKKAPVLPVKKIWPGFKGCVIRLAKGESGKSPEQAARQELPPAPLILTEGIEDGLSLSLACPQYRVWAAGTLGNMANIPKHPCISSVTIAADNDFKPQAKAAFAGVLNDLKRRDFSVKVARAWDGKDANDLLLKGADDAKN